MLNKFVLRYIHQRKPNSILKYKTEFNRNRKRRKNYALISRIGVNGINLCNIRRKWTKETG